MLVTNLACCRVRAEVRGSSCGSLPSAINGVRGRACVPRHGRDGQAYAQHLHHGLGRLCFEVNEKGYK